MTLDPSKALTACLSEDGVRAAVAWRGEDLITLAFYENLGASDGEYVYTYLHEVRAFAVPDDYPQAMPVEELSKRLQQWEAYDLPRLDAAIGPNEISPRGLRAVPFGQMKQAAVFAYLDSEAPAPLVLPTEQELDCVRAAGPWPEFRSSRDMESAFEQLKAVAAYVAAVEAGEPKPIVSASRTLFGDEARVNVTRMRNLIQFARQNGYLTKSQYERPGHGRPGGIPTRKAMDLCVAIKERAAQARGGEA